MTEAAAGKAPGQLKAKGMKVHIHTPAEIDAMRKVMRPPFDKAFAEATGASGKTLLGLLGQ
jgi:C4-dicarboxylate-binding protein DctP